MSQTTFRYLKTIFSAMLILLTAGLVIACGTTPKPLPRPAADQDVAVAVVPPPTPATSAAPTPPPAIIAPDDGCVECHSSEETLKATAKEEVVAEALSEGEG